MPILLVFPHCDMHLALNTPGADRINYRVFRYRGTGPYTLEDITPDCTFQLLAPHNEVPNRLEAFVNIDVDAETITATKTGTNLVIFHYTSPTNPADSSYIVARVQVHDRMLSWWFGNRSVTTALDPARGHTQPSVYASFTADPTGTDIVGDITGHDFVKLDESDPTVFTIDNADHRGRLRGIKEGEATLNGAFLAKGDSIPVRVVDYSKPPNPLEQVRVHDLPNAARMHNLLFLAEGFRAGDKPTFDEIVKKVAADLFSKPRHEPFGALSGSFNMFKAFTPSKDNLISCGFKVTDTAVKYQRKGRPIPNNHRASKNGNTYDVSELVDRVGLPQRGEARSRAALVMQWNDQSLHDFDERKVDDDLFEAWRASQAVGFLEDRDTTFGMRLGGRYADSRPRRGQPLALVAADDGSDALKALVRRAYEFYSTPRALRIVNMDPRRHPPELYLFGQENPTTSLMQFISALQLDAGQRGDLWVPGGPDFKPSRGLIVMICNEPMLGGASINSNTLLALDVNHRLSLPASYVPHPPPPATPDPNIHLLRRDESGPIEVDFGETIDTIAHELGHALRLGDEYEDFPVPDPDDFAQRHLNAAANQSDNFDSDDNITSLETIFLDPVFLNSHDWRIDVDKVKWNRLPRIRLSARLTADAAFTASKIESIIDKREAHVWDIERKAGTEVYLRSGRIQPSGIQLPLSAADEDFLIGLKIDNVDTTTGLISLTSTIPLPASPDIRQGSYLFIPHRVEGGGMRTLIDPKVRDDLASKPTPLNSDTDAAHVKKEPDEPRAIAGFEPPCVSARVIGVYEGAAHWSGLVYRPAGTCKMRTNGGKDENGEFCFVCKWLITNRVDPGQHGVVDRKFYPSADKKKC